MGETPKPDSATKTEDQKYCPLAPIVSSEGTHLPCGKEACAWWLPKTGNCSVHTIARYTVGKP